MKNSSYIMRKLLSILCDLKTLYKNLFDLIRYIQNQDF